MTQTTTDGLALLAAIRDALATPSGARLAREIKGLLARLDQEDDSAESYAARAVARAYARAEGHVAKRPRGARRRGAGGAP